MQHYSCKCGESTSFGSMAPNPCAKCEKCGTSYGWLEGRQEPPEPKPHDWQMEMVDTDDGEKSLTRCSWCFVKKLI